MDKPKVRHGIEAIPVRYQGKQMILLRDRLGYSDRTLLVSPAWARVLALMDGTNSLRDIQAEIMRRTGELIYSDDIEKLVAQLDDCLFLENDSFFKKVTEAVESYLKDPVRRAVHAGLSYPEDPEELKRFLEGFFTSGDHPIGLPETPVKHKKVMGLVVPHIDLRLGGRLYAMGYKYAYESVYPDTWIVIGTSHEPVEHHIALTVKDFETPFGILACNREICKEIMTRLPFDITDGEFNHAREHTVEFQAIFIKMFQPNAKIVPLVCSFSEDELREERERLNSVIEVLRDILNQEKAAIIASVDFAHIGPRYGDNYIPDKRSIESNLQDDRAICEALAAGDIKRFETLLWRDHERRKICGAGPLYVLANSMPPGVRGSVLGVSHGVVDDQNSFVTFATVAFWRRIDGV